MAYELLTGRPPFIDRPAQAILAAHISEAPVPIERLRADTPRPAADLIMQCLAKDPASRPQTAAAILGALDAAHRSGGGIVVGRRLRALTYGGAIVAAAIVVMVGGFTWSRASGFGPFASLLG